MEQLSQTTKNTPPPISAEEVQAASKRMTSGAKNMQVKTPLFPVPDDAPECCYKHPEYGEPAVLYPYHNAEAKLLGYIARFETHNGKEILPLTYCDIGKGRRAWRAKGFEKPRPLFNLPEMLARPNAPILVTEGEKAALAAKILFPSYVATTAMHGAQSPQHTDWSTVASRTVIISPDYDEAGESYADIVYDVCMEAGATACLRLPPETLGAFALDEAGKPINRDSEIPKGYDLADALAEGWTAPQIAAFFAESLTLPYIKKSELVTLQESLPQLFRLKPYGVEYLTIKKIDGVEVEEWKWFCSFLAIPCQTRDATGINWGRVLELIDNDGIRKELVMPMSALAGDGREYREELYSHGLRLAPQANNTLKSYITMANPKARALCVTKQGWHGENYILPHTTYGETKCERVVLQQSGAPSSQKSKGTLAEWQEHVAAKCEGNSRLMLAISAALCAPLLHLLGEENFGLHFSGGSSIGKTTSLIVAASVYGVEIGSWRTTDNAAESLARQANDSLLLLDELSQADAFAADAMAYMLGNGAGKSRANRSGAARTTERFRLVFLSTGEMGLSAKMQEVGRAQKAGQEVRFIEVEADAGKGFGIFDALGNAIDGSGLSLELKDNAHRFCGAAFDAFMQKLIASKPEAVNAIQAARTVWAEQYIPSDADGQAMRVGNKFALIAAAGELAISFGVLPWPCDSVSEICARIYGEWMDKRGGNIPYEWREAETRLRSLIIRDGNSRFEEAWHRAIDDEPKENQRTINRAGFKKLNDTNEWEYFIIPEVFESEVLTGGNKQAIKRHLADKELLIRDSQGKYTNSIKIPGQPKAARYYKVPASVMEGSHAGE